MTFKTGNYFHFRNSSKGIATRIKNIKGHSEINTDNMGLSIHYSGNFNKHASLSEMIEEVKDIVEIYKWEYTIHEEQFPPNNFGKKTFNKKIYGISFTPPECETVSLSFLSNGKMSCSVRLKYFGNSTNEAEQQYLTMLAVKTQYAGIEIHKLIVHLLKYLSKKYFTDFKVDDEGKYWESGDEKLLNKIFRQYNDLLQNVSFGLQNCPIKKGETFEQYFERILKRSHNNKKTD